MAIRIPHPAPRPPHPRRCGAAARFASSIFLIAGQGGDGQRLPRCRTSVLTPRPSRTLDRRAVTPCERLWSRTGYGEYRSTKGSPEAGPSIDLIVQSRRGTRAANPGLGARRREGRAARHQGGRRQDAVRAREELARARGVPQARGARAVAVRVPWGSARAPEPPESGSLKLQNALAQRSTRSARRVFQRLGSPARPSISKCTVPGCGFSSGHRPFSSRFFATRSTASAMRSSGAKPALHR